MVHNNKKYYDEFSNWYDRERFEGYHAFIDEMEFKILKHYCEGKKVLEAGCGTGLILKKISELSAEAYGIDISTGMLEKSIERGLNVSLGSVTDIPYDDATFDTVYSVKVISHVKKLDVALKEMVRVTKKGGYIIPEFYNKRSFRYLIKLLRPGMKISPNTTDKEVFTKYYTFSEFLSHMPEDAEFVKLVGVRIITIFPQLFKVRFINLPLKKVESLLAYTPFNIFGGFLLPVFVKK